MEIDAPFFPYLHFFFSLTDWILSEYLGHV